MYTHACQTQYMHIKAKLKSCLRQTGGPLHGPYYCYYCCYCSITAITITITSTSTISIAITITTSTITVTIVDLGSCQPWLMARSTRANRSSMYSWRRHDQNQQYTKQEHEIKQNHNNKKMIQNTKSTLVRTEAMTIPSGEDSEEAAACPKVNRRAAQGLIKTYGARVTSQKCMVTSRFESI